MNMQDLKRVMGRSFLWLIGKLLPNSGFKIPDDSPFQPLTPTEDAKDIEAYVQAMDFAYSPKNGQIRNIAVTGRYGAGKSSFLRTCFKGRDEVLWVSLASFLDHVAEEERGSSEFGHKLELSILQQIFHARKESRLWSWKFVFALLLICGGLLGIIQPDLLVKYVSSNVHTWVISYAAMIFWISCGVVSVVSLLSIRRLVLWGKSFRIKSVNVKGGGVGELGIEIPDNVTWSILNRNVQSIIDFFASTNFTTVIFEDIDRFGDLRIFTKLREINLLLNNSREIKEKHKPIRFIYALREELFKDEKSKVKFFDFVIPIIPRINASNSRTELLDFMKNWGDKNLDNGLKRFVKEISPYISDMRLLKNMCNEYFTYKSQIKDFTSEEELLGLIVFKNFFPESFALMHDGQGMMWDLMQAKKAAQNNVINEIDNKIQTYTAEIKDIENEKFTDVKQLQCLYYATLMNAFSRNNDSLQVDNQIRSASEIIHMDNWFDKLKSNRLYRSSYGNRLIEWSEIEKRTDPTCSYDEHVKRIDSRANGQTEKIKYEIQKLRDRRLSVKRKTIKDLLAENALTEDAVVSLVNKYSEDRQDAELMLILLKNGYLNERYQYNISIFHEVEGVNSFSDYIFEIGVMRGEDMDWDNRIINPQVMVETLDIHYFSTDTIRNYDICAELLQSPQSDKAKEFWKFISQKDKRNYEFVDGFLSCSRYADRHSNFIDCIMKANEKYIEGLIETSSADSVWPRAVVDKQVGMYVAWSLKRGHTVGISATVTDYINELPAFAELLEENGIKNEDELVRIVQNFRLKFKVLDCRSASETGLLDVIIANRAYSINEKLMRDMLIAKGVSVEGMEAKNYSVICNCGIAAIIDYVDTQFSDYLENLYLKLELPQEDLPELIVKVFNREDLSDDEKISFVKKQSEHGRVKRAKDLANVNTLNLVIKLDWLQASWNNAADVWNRNKDDLRPFWEFVGRARCYGKLSEKNSRNVSWEEDAWWAKRFAETEEETLPTVAMSALLAGMSKGVITDYSGTNATPKRIECLVRDGRIKFSKELYQSLRNRTNDSHITLAAMCIRDFCDEYSDGMIKADEIRKLIKSEHLHRRNLPLTVNILKGIVCEDEGLCSDMAVMINKGNYGEIDESVLDSVLRFVTQQSLQCKIIMHLGGTANEIRERLWRMGEPYNKLGEPGCRPQLVKWDGIEQFLEFLKRVGIVSSTSDKADGKIQVNTTQS